MKKMYGWSIDLVFKSEINSQKKEKNYTIKSYKPQEEMTEDMIDKKNLVVLC